MVAVAAVPFWPVYASAEFVVLVVVTLVVGAAISVAGAVLRLSSFTVLLTTLVAYVILGVPLAIPSRALFGALPTLDGLRELLVGTALSWTQLVTVTLPVGSYQSLLVPVFVLVLVGTVVGLSVALRSRRGELAVIPPIVVFVAGIVLGPAEPTLPVASGLGLLVVTTGWLVWWRLRRRRLAIEALGGAVSSRGLGHGTVALRAVVGSTITLAIAGAAAFGAVSVLPPSTDRIVARTVIEQPFDPRDYVSPLTRFRAYEQQPTVDETLFSVTGLREGQKIRLATLDTYDGVSYTVGSRSVTSESGSFDRVPSIVDQSGVDGTQTSLDVSVGAYDGVWLPTVGKLEDIAFAGPTAAARRDSFFYNDTSGTAAVIGGVSRGDAYRIDAVEPSQPDESALGGLTPGDATVPAPESVPDALVTALDAYTEGVTGPGARLEAALAGLRSNGYISHGVSADEPVSRSGHGADRIAQLFTDPLMIGDAEQYATAAALMADRLGFPARVVMGFAPAEGTAGGSVEVTGKDVTAWIEVDTSRYGWVALDPNPEERPIPEDQLQEPSQISRPESVVQPPPQEPQIRDEQAPPQTEQDSPDAPPAWLAIVLLVGRIVGWVAAALGVLAAPFIVIAAVKARRRRRRRRLTEPGARITAGWQEFADSVADHGIETPRSATRSEIAAVVGGARPGVLARVADRAVFSPTPPPAADADRVWQAVGEMRKSLDTGLSRWQRFKAAVSLRSLRGYHGGIRSER
ncbi:transglutaminaseTgpA domain-containing protein [Frigoribacterium sp. 2-23]|uniref:transglutaminaseTgpA domain-containing protein n=1 Tax=Frigoribacterium sp. 2-23 TaxID=3415006 RepID=UPI003C6EC476